MSLPRPVLAIVLVLVYLVPLAADQAKASDEVVVPVISSRGKVPLREALKDVQKQSGVSVRDALGKDAPDVVLNLEKVPFWRAIDSITAAAKAKPVQSLRDGSIVLQPMTEDDQPPTVSYDGPFRTRVTRITNSREFDSVRRNCVVALEVNWTPTLRPLFLESQAQRVTMRDGNGKDVPVAEEGSSLVPVDGRFNYALELTLPALPREHKHITSLRGRLLAVTPTKMIRFAFDSDLAELAGALKGGDQRKATLENVVCRIAKVTLGRDAWSVQISLDYPEGNRQLESFQAASLVANNELTLTSKDGKRKLSPSGSLIDLVSSRRAVVTYHFTDAKKAPRGKASDWKVGYTAPARVVEVPFTFSFDKLPLP